MHTAFPRRMLLFAQKSFIVTHQQLAFQCFHDIQCNANHDNQCSTTEANIHLENPLQRNRNHSQDCVADCANQCDSAYHSGDISAGGLTGSDTRDEATVLLHVHRNFIGVDHDGCVEICEEDNQ